MTSIWYSGGQKWLDELQMDDAYTNRVESLRDLLKLYHREIATLDGLIHLQITANDDLVGGYEAIQTIGGVGRVLAGVFVAEIGDVSRFPNPKRLCSWAGLTPRHRESDEKVRGVGSPNEAQPWSSGPVSALSQTSGR